MKKTLVILAFVAAAMSSSAQWFDFSNNKNRFDLGVQFGVPGIG